MLMEFPQDQIESCTRSAFWAHSFLVAFRAQCDSDLSILRQRLLVLLDLRIGMANAEGRKVCSVHLTANWSVEMSAPRCFFPKKVYHVSRRCTQRMFLLKPSPVVSNAFKYCLAIAAEKFQMFIYSFTVLSNHYHMVLGEDSEEVQLPKFMAWLNLHLAKILNKHYNRKENFWSSEPYSAVLLVGKEAILDAIVYVQTNAVKHNLVKTPEQWPGLHCKLSQLGKETFTGKKPSLFFRRVSELPSEASFQLSIPPQLDLEMNDYRCLVKKLVKHRLEELREQRIQNGQKVLGRHRICAQSPHSRPKEEDTSPKHRPVISCKDRGLRKKILNQIKEFWNNYREALHQWKNGVRDVSFPMGTYFMRVFHKVQCINYTALT
jgi:putative transposase